MGVLYVCVHLCTSWVSEPLLLIVKSGMEGVGVAEINAKTVWTVIQLFSELSDRTETSSRFEHTVGVSTV